MITLYSYNTPNGLKPTILLEELQVPYTIQLVDIFKGEQFEPGFLKISPNNKIPAMYDSDADLNVFESVAILQYLAEKHQRFIPMDLTHKIQVLQWCYFQVGHIGPMFGQYGHFHQYADVDVPYAKKRYAEECERLLGVMERQLTNHDYMSGQNYTIADMAIWPWIYGYSHYYEATIDAGVFPNLMRWYDEVLTRQAVKKAIAAYEEH